MGYTFLEVQIQNFYMLECASTMGSFSEGPVKEKIIVFYSGQYGNSLRIQVMFMIGQKKMIGRSQMKVENLIYWFKRWYQSLESPSEKCLQDL